MQTRFYNILLLLNLFSFISGCSSIVFFSAVYGTHNKKHSKGYVEEGFASFYSNDFVGLKTASGEVFNPEDLTAAHRSIPFGTLVKVTNLKNGRQIVVKVNDRGPFVEGRIIDLTRRAAELLDVKNQGVTMVRIEIVE
ncbi:MAG: septal ring lytic transglycosylase RlpA family protein [Candidatus Kapaibacteriota bacterium]|jgi:rare lipoprotein A